MASIKVMFRPSEVENRKGTIYYRIIHERKIRQLNTGFHILKSEWDMRENKIHIGNCGSDSLISDINAGIRSDLIRLNKIVKSLDSSGIKYSADDIIEKYRHYSMECCLFNYMNRLIMNLRDSGRIRTSEAYASALKSFSKFRQNNDIMLDALDSKILESYEAWLRKRGVVQNSTSFYMRILRAVYNRAVDDGMIDDRKPFRRVYTGVDKTVKRALPLHVIKKIKELDLHSFPRLDYARDMFILSFMLRGMSFIDMAFLRKSDLVDEHIIYRRRKTGQLLSIKWTGEMRRIHEKYSENPNDYLLPILNRNVNDERRLYRNVSFRINRSLKIIARMIGLKGQLSLYVARHSWASAAKTKGIPISVISEGMGHDNVTTTQIYLASLSTSIIDRANAQILNCL